MLLIIAVLCVFLVNTYAQINSRRLSLLRDGGILTPNIKDTFKNFNEQPKQGLMEWDDDLAIKALKEAEKKHSSGVPLAIRTKLKFDGSEPAARIDVEKYIPVFLQKHGDWLSLLPPKLRYGCNGIVKIVFGPPKARLEIILACVYEKKRSENV